jgi:hypothetical protein
VISLQKVKILKYVDDLETGKAKRKPDLSIQEQAEEYRAELIRKVCLILNN